MGIIDILIVVFAVFFFVKGYRQGLIFSFFKVLAYLLGIIIAMNFSALLSAQLFKEPDGIVARIFPLLSYGILFFAVVMLVNLLGKWIQKTFSIPIVGTINRLAGGILYLGIFAFIASTFVWLGNKMEMLNDDTVNNTSLVTFVAPIAPLVFDNIGVVLPFIKNTYSDMNHFFEQLSGKIEK